MADIIEYFPMNYREKTWDEIFYTMLRQAYDNGLLSDDRNFLDYIQHKKGIENDLILTLSNLAVVIAQEYQELTNIHNSYDINKAIGNDLDVLGELFFNRVPESRSVTDLTFTCEEPNDRDVHIPLGFKVKHATDDTVIFETTEEKILLAGETSIKIKAQATMPGEMGNVPPDTLTRFVMPITGLDSVTNEFMTTGGSNRESDDKYRERLKKWRFILEKGTYNSLVNMIQEIPSVTSYYVERYWMGYGTVLVVIDPPTQVVLDLVNTEIEKIKAVDEEWEVRGVELVPVDASFIVNVTLDQEIGYSMVDLENIELSVQNYIRTYLDGGIDNTGVKVNPIPIGRDFVPFEVGKFVSKQIPEIRDFTAEYPQKPITILPYQRATSGEIKVKVV